MSQDRRLDKVEGSLTPRQTVILWLQEIQQYQNVYEYVQFLRGQPESAAPITRITGDIDQAVREAMKGRPKEVVEATVRRAVKDVVFLVKLHLQVNSKLLSDQQAWSLWVAVLAEMQNRMLTENILRNVLCYMRIRVNLEMPYPLDADTAAAVEAAIRHHVTTWEQLEEAGTLEDWLYNHLVTQGTVELPEVSYEFRDGKLYPRMASDNEKEVQSCFKNEADFEKFRSGVDYHNGLTGITDAEFSAYYERMVTAVHELVDSGQEKVGVVVCLETVPIPFLREAPLLDGEWLDRYLAELATWGALLRDKGYDVHENEDDHPLALVAFIRSDGKEADRAEIKALRRRAALSLAKFPGRTRKIDGRPHIHFEDYHHWLKRKVKGNLSSGVKKGLVTASWNYWVDAHSGDDVASVAGVPVARLHCYVDECSYQICQNVDEQLRRREQLLESLHIWHSKPDRKAEQLQDWKNVAETFLIDLYAFQDAVAFISKHYFDCHQILFPDSAKRLSDLLKETKELVGMFNDSCTEEIEKSYRIDLEEVRKGAGEKAAEQTAYLVDMAKAEALDALGERQAAMALAERHL